MRRSTEQMFSSSRPHRQRRAYSPINATPGSSRFRRNDKDGRSCGTLLGSLLASLFHRVKVIEPGVIGDAAAVAGLLHQTVSRGSSDWLRIWRSHSSEQITRSIP